MTAQSSKGNFTKFGTYFLYKLKTLRPMLILNSIFALLSYPLAAALALAYTNIENQISAMRAADPTGTGKFYSSEAYQQLTDQLQLMTGIMFGAFAVCAIMLVCLVVMSYIIPTKSFRWLYKKSVVDMDYSLPVSNDTRFFGDLLAGFAGTLVPHGAAVGIGAVLLRCIDTTYMREDTARAITVVILCMLTGLLACFMFSALTLLVMSLCGRTAEARIYPFAINIIIPIIHLMCLMLIFNNTYGFSSTVNSFESVAVSSPAGLVFYSLVYVASGNGSEQQLPIAKPELFVPAIIISLLCLVGAYFIVKFRRAERVGNPFVNIIPRLAMPFLVIFAIVIPFAAVIQQVCLTYDPTASYNPEPWGYVFAGVFITFVVYVIMELISGRGFKKFYLTLAKYAGTVAVSVLLCFGLHLTNGFGMSEYVPAVSDVKSVELELNDYSNNTVRMENYNATMLEADSIKAVADKIHSDIVKSERYTDDEWTGYQVSITYVLKSGSEVKRWYRVNEEQFRRYAEAGVTPEGYYNSFEERWFERLSGTITSAKEGDENISLNIPFEKFKEAFRKDCENATSQWLYDRNTVAVPVVYFTCTPDITTENLIDSVYPKMLSMKIYPWYENLTALLTENGIGTMLRYSL